MVHINPTFCVYNSHTGYTEIQLLCTELVTPNMSVTSLSHPFLKNRCDMLAKLLVQMKQSIIHRAIHVTTLQQILDMYELGRNMIDYYHESLIPTHTDADVLKALSHALFYSNKLRTRFWYVNSLICYCFQFVPIATWAHDACVFLDIINSAWWGAVQKDPLAT